LEKHNNSRKNSELTSKRAKSRGPVQRDTKEVLAELVGKLQEKLDRKKVAARSFSYLGWCLCTLPGAPTTLQTFFCGPTATIYSEGCLQDRGDRSTGKHNSRDD
jgi:predicted dienelactone hydrolase